MKKTLSILLIVTMLLGLMPLAVFAADATPEGTPITTAEELYNMADNGKYYLANDITITQENSIYFKDPKEGGGYKYGEGWKYRSPLVGITLDGNGKTIYYADGLTIYAGLFSEVNGVTIKNLNVVQQGKVTYKGLGGEVTALVRRIVGGTVNITNVNAYADILLTEANGANQAGGIVAGLNRPGSLYMENCVFRGSITKNYRESGDNNDKGVAGMLGGTWTDSNGGIGSITIKKCINYANITSETYAGGIFGYVRNNDNWTDSTGIGSILIQNCVNYGDITCNQTEFVGGIFGFYRMNAGKRAEFMSNVNYGEITAKASNGKAGGIGGGLRQNADTKAYLHGNVNYGVINGNGKSTGVAKAYNESGKNVWDRLWNYCSDASVTNSGSGGEAITEGTLSQLSYFGANMYTTLPNGKIGLTWAKQAGYGDVAPGNTATAFVGAQLSGTATDKTRNVRFVGGLTGDYSNLDQVGVQIIAKDVNGNQLDVFEGETTTLYTSIIAGGDVIYADEEAGVEYFYTAVINGVPTELGTVIFEVFTYQLADGAVAYSNSTTLTVNMAG